MNASPQPQVRVSVWHRLRVLRPLGVWALLVLAMFGYRTHERLLAETRLSFVASVPGEAQFSGEARLDGQPFRSDSLVSLGPHTLTIQHPKAEPFTSEFWVWYGGRNFGGITLVRAQGTLVVSADPPAPRLTIRGPELSLSLTNSTGITSSVPTDRYVIEAQYSHWRDRQEVTVRSGSTESQRFAPKFGAMRIEANRPDVAFVLRNAEGETVWQGSTPVLLGELPAAPYRVLATYLREQQEVRTAVGAGETNTVQVDFTLGSASMESEPAGAEIVGADGRRWGVTPVLLHDLRPGKWEFVLRKDGHLPASASVQIVADQTNRFQTTLVNADYAQAISAAREYLTQGDPDRALEVLEKALEIKPGDLDAMKLQRQAGISALLKRANLALRQQDYAAARKAIEGVLQSAPGNPEATALLSTLETGERQKAELEEQQVAEREGRKNLAALRQLFDQLQEEFRPTGGFYEEHELRTGKPLIPVREAVYKSLVVQEPSFTARSSSVDAKDALFGMVATQEVTGGLRRCIIAGARTGRQETRILYKVLEYKSPRTSGIGFRITIGGTPAPPTYTHIIPNATDLTPTERLQLRSGIQMVTERLKAALTPSP